MPSDAPFAYVRMLLMALLLGRGGAGCAAGRFHSDMLQRMAETMCVPDSILGLGDGYHYRAFAHKGRDITVGMDGGEVVHLGFTLFNATQREGMGPAADFMERYWLWTTLPMHDVVGVAGQMRQDGVVFEAGGLESIDRLLGDSTLTFKDEVVMDRLHNMEWQQGGKTVCRISFPIHHELLLGRKMLENDRRLPTEIMTAGRCRAKSPDASCQSVYAHDKRMHKVACMLTGAAMDEAENYSLLLRQQTYNYNQTLIETNIGQFVSYCLRNGCRAHVGKIADDGTCLDVELFMRNAAMGYVHVVRMQIDLSHMEQGRGSATARLNPFVPISNMLKQM